jgi:hypothetical protein
MSVCDVLLGKNDHTLLGANMHSSHGLFKKKITRATTGTGDF